MTTSDPIGPLLACALSDSYGAGFEFATAKFIQKHNRVERYIPHPKFNQRPATCYTDDTQMALGLAEHMLSDDKWTPLALATRWVEGFHRDQRTGYSQHFYDLLMVTVTGQELLASIQPHSAKNGGSMRAFPIGFLTDPEEVRDKAMMQASLTHATWGGMSAAAAAALMFHHRYHRLGPKSDLVPFLNKWVPDIDWGVGVKAQGSPTGGVPTVQKAVAVFLEGHSLTDVLHLAVSLGGDTDTIAAIAAPAAAVCPETRNALPPIFHDGLENGTYGRDYLKGIDERLLVKFPRRDQVPVVRPPKPPAKSKARSKVPVAAEDEGPLDFLFE